MRLVVGLGLLVGLVQGAGAACLQSGKAGQAAEGKLITAAYKSAAGGTETVYLLQLKAAGCLAGDSESNPRDVRRLHLFRRKPASARSWRA